MVRGTASTMFTAIATSNSFPKDLLGMGELGRGGTTVSFLEGGHCKVVVVMVRKSSSSVWLLVQGGRQWKGEEEEGELLVGLGGRSRPYEFKISLERRRDNSGGMGWIRNCLNPTKVGSVDHPISKI